MIVWLASYPKSGNTWLRAFISSMLYSNDGKMNGNLWEKIDQFPNLKHFEGIIEDKDIFKLNNRNDISKIFEQLINSQDKINLDNKIKIFKTHFLNCKIDNHNFTNHTNTIGVIHIVRDPRNIVTSIMNHYDLTSVDEACEFLLNDQKWIGVDKINGKTFPKFISSWNNHYNLWKQSKKNYLLIKYENLITNPENEFKKIKEYFEKILSVTIKNEIFSSALNTTNFESLKKLETNNQFDENNLDKKGKKIPFFKLGKKNNWNEFLNKDITNKIENKFYSEMKELNYI